MAERGEYTITEAGYAAMAKAKPALAALQTNGSPRDDYEITPAGLAAMRDYELAHATAQGAEQVPGARFLPVQLAAASPERPAAAADSS